jgi:Squalene epoxidase
MNNLIFNELRNNNKQRYLKPTFRNHNNVNHPSSPVSANVVQVRCMVDVPGGRLPHSPTTGALQAYLRDHVAPQLPEQLQGAFLKGLREGPLRTMQCKVLPPAPLHRPGALLLGDSFNMRHPVTGAVPGNRHSTPPLPRAPRPSPTTCAGPEPCLLKQ